MPASRHKTGDRVRAVSRLEQENRRLQRARTALLGVQKASAAVASRLDPGAALQEIAKSALKVVDGDAAAIFLLNEEAQRLEPKAAAGAIGPDAPRDMRPPSTRTRVWRDICRRGGLVIGDTSNSPNLGNSGPYLTRAGVKSLITAPLTARGAVIGAISVSSRRRKRAFRRSDLGVLRLFADQAALALDNSQLFQQVTAWSARAYDQLELGKAMLDGIRDPVVLLNNQNRIIFGNPALFDVLGRKPSQVLGREPGRFLDRVDSEALNAVSAASDGSFAGLRVHLIRPDGSRMPVSISAGESHSVSGELVGTLAVIRPLTDTRGPQGELGNSLRMLAALGRLTDSSSKTFDAKQLADYVLRIALESLGAQWGLLYLFEGGEFVLAASRGMNDGFLKLGARWTLADNPAKRVLAARKPLVFPDVWRLPGLARKWRPVAPPEARSAVICPLLGRESPIGVLAVGAPDATPFTDEAVSMLNVLAGQFVAVLENARLYAAARRRAERLATLNEAAAELLSCSEPGQVVSILCRGIARALDARRAICLDHDWSSKHMVAIGGHKVSARLLKRLPRTKLASAPLLAMSVSERQAVSVEDAAKTGALPPDYYRALGAGPVVAVPVIGRKELHGIVLADNGGEPISVSDGQQGMVMTLANQTATTLENLFLLREERERSRQLSLAVQEAHHRIKNNLQSVCDLLELELLQPERERSSERIEHSVQRVRAIALVHDFLSRHQDLSTVDAQQVLERLVPLVLASSNGGEKRIDAIVRVDPIKLGSKQTTALALIVNELVSNAVRHGLHNSAGGRVSVGLTERKGSVRLHVTDNGRGLPDGFDMNTGAHVGLEIARVLTQRDLAGTFSIGGRGGRRRGTVVRVKFPKQ